MLLSGLSERKNQLVNRHGMKFTVTVIRKAVYTCDKPLLLPVFKWKWESVCVLVFGKPNSGYCSLNHHVICHYISFPARSAIFLFRGLEIVRAEKGEYNLFAPGSLPPLFAFLYLLHSRRIGLHTCVPRKKIFLSLQLRRGFLLSFRFGGKAGKKSTYMSSYFWLKAPESSVRKPYLDISVPGTVLNWKRLPHRNSGKKVHVAYFGRMH